MDILFPEPDHVDRERQALAARLAASGVNPSTIAAAFGGENDQALADAFARQGSTYLAYPFENHFFGNVENPEVQRSFQKTIRNPPPVTFDAVLRPPGPLPEMVSANAYLPPIPVLAQSARGNAFVDVDHDVDGVLRAMLTVIKFNDRLCAPMFLALVSAYRDHARLVLSLTSSTVGGVAVGSTRIPVDEMGRMLIDFRGRLREIATFSAISVMSHKIPEESLKGKIVLVGVSAAGLGDRVVTPLGSDIPGVRAQAAAVDNVLAGKFLRRSEATEGETVIFAILLGLAVTLAVSELSAVRSAILGLLLLGGYLAYAQYRLLEDGVMIGVILPATTVVVTDLVLSGYRYVTEDLKKRRLRRAFVHYLAPSIVDQLTEDGVELKLGGEERIITVMFADLTGFTVASTHMNPEALTGKVNRYFDVIVRPVDETGGYVERFLGDSALCFWNAPLPNARHHVQAVRAAFEIIEGVRRAREEDEARGDTGFTIKVGINTGPAVVGNIGSKNRYSYTAMGEDVNLAARLEGVPPLYGCLIVIGEHTAAVARNEFLLRELDWILAKGAAKGMAIYQPVAPLDRATDAQRELVARFAEGLAHYRAMRFAEAVAIWDELVAKYEPEPSPSSIMGARARHFTSLPPPASWDGVFVLTSK
jgi:adenylate cyclase